MSTAFAKTPLPSNAELEAMPLAKRVDRGIRLQRIMKRAEAEVERLKALFRSEGDKRREVEPDLSPVHFLGNIGTCKVTYKGASIKVKEDKKEKAIELKESLPPEIFFRMFDVVTIAKPVKDFKDRFEKLNPAQQAIILQYFEKVPNSPAVEFSK